MESSDRWFEARRGSIWRRALAGALALALAIAASVLLAGAARGDGSCGQDYTNATACPVSGTGQTLSGQIVAKDDVDHYVFYAAAETHVAAGIMDEENYEACYAAANCGEAKIKLVSSSGKVLSEAETNLYREEPGVALGYITRKAGIYYIDVSGQLEGSPIPYALSIAGNPALIWPAPGPATTPPPDCIVPKLVGLKLGAAKKKLRKANCAVGRVTHVRGRGRGRGRVLASSPKKGHRLHPGGSVRLKLSR